ncbi:hypothetical protein KEM56_004154 [Ascosphaera pollenicola]|nr:hypothetical protein KEM56_004154 [Ascosphaera pollenicola]
MAAPFKQWGVTPAVSTQLPTDEELAANDDLITELKTQNNFEAPAETERRRQTLALFQKVTTEFVKVVGRRKKLSQGALDVAGGKIFAYGSYRLGVYGPGSDIDTLVVAPKHVLIEDFFEDFPPILEQMSPPGAIEKLTPVPDAFVPLIKIEFSGISIDLIFARLHLHSIPLNLDLKNTDLLRGLDEKEIRSVNGTRVTDEILELVPQQKTFRLALRAIKLWAQRRAIYSNVVGFPGGVAWAMLVARVCQLYPQATGSVIVGRFFRIMNQWQWPQPVLLKPIEDGPLHMKVWNPKAYTSDRFHLMPIITPAYPSMCATHNVSQSTMTVILRELKRGENIVQRIFDKNLTWHDLFTKHTFFTRDYKYYLSITSSSTTKEAQAVWSGLVESKLRHLVGALDRKPIIYIAHPFPKGFERVHICRTKEEVLEVKSGSMKYKEINSTTETTDTTNDPKHANAAQGATDSGITAMATGGDQPVTEEKSMADNPMRLYTTTYYIGLEIKPTYELPDDVFEANETKPVKPKKKIVRKSTGAAPPPVANATPSTPTAQKRTIDALDATQESESKRHMLGPPVGTEPA